MRYIVDLPPALHNSFLRWPIRRPRLRKLWKAAASSGVRQTDRHL